MNDKASSVSALVCAKLYQDANCRGRSFKVGTIYGIGNATWSDTLKSKNKNFILSISRRTPQFCWLFLQRCSFISQQMLSQFSRFSTIHLYIVGMNSLKFEQSLHLISIRNGWFCTINILNFSNKILSFISHVDHFWSQFQNSYSVSQKNFEEEFTTIVVALMYSCSHTVFIFTRNWQTNGVLRTSLRFIWKSIFEDRIMCATKFRVIWFTFMYSCWHTTRRFIRNIAM